MAHISQRGRTWRVEVFKRGVRDSATFDSERVAKEWGARREAEILTGKRHALPGKTVRDIFQRRIEQLEGDNRDAARWEGIRLKKLSRDPLADVALTALDQTHVAEWRDRTLQTLKPGSVRREWSLLSPLFELAVKEWKWLPENPMRGVKRPKKPSDRNRRVSDAEIKEIRTACGYEPRRKPQTKMARVAMAFEFAIETGMREAEIARLEWRHVHLGGRYVHNERGKTQAARRDVPLTKRAAAILRELMAVRDGELAFNLTTSQIESLFRKACKMRQIADLHFHDSRREAVSRLSKKLNVLELARAIGHADLKQLMTYYQDAASELAKKL
jgi:integrase